VSSVVCALITTVAGGVVIKAVRWLLPLSQSVTPAKL